MKLNKLNDWVKILVVQLVAGMLTVIYLEIYDVTKSPLEMYLMFLFSALTVVYYVFSGIFLRNIKMYKIIIVWGLLLIVAIFAPIRISWLLSGGVMMFATNFYHFIDDEMQHIAYSFPICFFGPFVITYISMKISRYREAKLQPYLDEIMKENEEKNKDINC